jgi:hypothetical protein
MTAGRNVREAQLTPANVIVSTGGSQALVGFTAGIGGLTSADAIMDRRYTPQA